MGKVWAFFNLSGGVGKTTLTQNLGFHLNKEHGAKVLLVDIDPQASLTTFMGHSPTGFKTTITDSILDTNQQLTIVDCDWCHLAPTNIYLAKCEIKLGGVMQKEMRLKMVLDKVKDGYDIILIDCPPSLGQLAINCLAAADNLLIPIQTEYKSVEATINLLGMTYEIVGQINPELKVFGVVPTMYDSRNKSHKESIEMITGVFEKVKKNPLFQNTVVFNPIPRRIDFATATRKHCPLALHIKNHPALKKLSTIAEAIYGTLEQPISTRRVINE